MLHPPFSPAAVTLPNPNSPQQPQLLSGESSGLQVLLVSHPLREAGLLHNLTLKVPGSSSLVDLQIWRPAFRGGYKLQWYIALENSNAVMREKDHILFHDSLGVPVKRGDVLGYRSSAISPMDIVYSSPYNSHSGGGGGMIYYMEGVSSSLCTLSLCDGEMKTVFNIFPSLTYSKFVKNMS